MESTRTLPSPSIPPSGPSSVSEIQKINTSLSTGNTEPLVATENSDAGDAPTAQSQTSREPHSQYLHVPTSVLLPGSRFIDGHISLIIGISCGVVVLGILAFGYSFWRFRKSRRREPIVTVDKDIVESSSLTENLDAPSPSVEKSRRCCQIGSLPLRQPPPSNSFGPIVLTPSPCRPLGNQLHIEASQNPTPGTHHVLGSPLQKGFPNLKHDKTLFPRISLLPGSRRRPAEQQFSFNIQHRQNFDPNPPSPSLRNFASQAGPLSYGLASLPYQHYSSCQQSSSSKEVKPIHLGPPCHTSFPNASSQYRTLKSSSEDSGSNFPDRNIIFKPFPHYPSSRQAHFSPPQMSPTLSNNPMEKSSPEHRAKFTAGSRYHSQNRTSIVYNKFVPFDDASFTRPSHVLPRNASRPVIPRIQIPVPAKNSGMPRCARGTPIPSILQPGCPISLQRKRLDSHESSGSARTNQILSPSQREIKASMFLSPCNVAPQTQAVTSRPGKHGEEVIEERAAKRNSSPKRSLGCTENTKPLNSSLPFPGQYLGFSKDALGDSLP